MSYLPPRSQKGLNCRVLLELYKQSIYTIIMNKQRSKNQVKLTGSKKLLFNFLLLFIPFLIFFIIEIFLRIIGYGDNLNLCIDFPGKRGREYKIINPDIGKKYFQKLEYTKPHRDIYLKEKPENGFRIFVLGSSTVDGFPYERNLVFSEILRERLQDSYPGKYIEVINPAITAINSYSLLDYIDEILRESPDAILIYAGHNEFYGAFGVGSAEGKNKYRKLTFLHLDLLSLRLYQLLRNVVNTMTGLFSGNKSEPGTGGTLMKLIAGNKEIVYKSDVYNKGIEIFRKNMDQLLKKAKRKDVPVFISELVSNVRDLKPFCSVAANDYPPAAEVFSEGRKCETEGEYEAARQYYYRAKDLDCIRFRASEEINEIIRGLAVRYDAYLVPMKSNYFENASANRLVGYKLITEHVHPNIEGCFLMADAFFIELARSKLPGEELNPVYYKNSAYYKRNWGYTELDSLVGEHKVNNLRYHWPFQPFNAPFVDYRQIYKPQSLSDSLALQVIKSDGIGIWEAHLEMAEYHRGKDDFYKAFKEYHAAIKCNPYIINAYLEAAVCLIHTNDLNLALEFLNKSLELQETVNAYFNIAEILFLKGDYDKAVEALNRISRLDNSKNINEKILIKLYKIYYYSGNNLKSQEILSKLKEINPDHKPYIPQKKKFVYYIPIQVENQVNRALFLYRSGDFDAALVEFLKSLEEKETSIANRCTGDILFSRNDSSAIVYYLKAYQDYKNDADFLTNMGILYLQDKQTEKAKDILEEIKKLEPDYKNIPLLEENIRAQSM